jgi:biopolymer transport protein ExbD
MAEIDQSGGGKKGGKQRAQKMSTKIDMTPMVDLGFLLITFFMLTTTLQKPSVLQLNMPDKTDDPKEDKQLVKASETLALIPGPHNKVYYFRGDPKDPNTKIEVTDFSKKGLRDVILSNKAAVTAASSAEKFVVVVMPMDKASYKNVVDLLDELAITGSDRYGITEPAPTILDMVKKSGKFVEP